MTATAATAAAALLRELVRADTSNPPGGETLAARVLERHLAPALECELVGPDPERLNFVACLRGRGGPSLALVAHLDVVPADPLRWETPPFAAEEEHGWIRGRGAVDIKCALASWAATLQMLAEDGFVPPGDVVLVAAADEEDGGAGVGMPWLVEHRPDLVRTDFALGEGSGERYTLDGRGLWLYGIGEKAPCKVTLRFDGLPGDISLPEAGENALAPLARALTALAAIDWPDERPAPLRPLLERYEAAGERDPALVSLVEAIRRIVAVPSLVEASRRDNVVPDEASVLVRAHVPPGTPEEALLGRLREAAPGARIESQGLEHGPVAPAETPLADALREFVATEEPDGELVPTIGPGFTDCMLLRQEFGTVAYGFVPFAVDPATNQATKHGIDERIHVEDLALQQRCTEAVIRSVDASSRR